MEKSRQRPRGGRGVKAGASHKKPKVGVLSESEWGGMKRRN